MRSSFTARITHKTTTLPLHNTHNPYNDDAPSSFAQDRRVWRVLDLVAPSLALPADVDWWGAGLPFSVPVDAPVTPEAVFAITRDHYEGTPYDLTRGLRSGPCADPAMPPRSSPRDGYPSIPVVSDRRADGPYTTNAL